MSWTGSCGEVNHHATAIPLTNGFVLAAVVCAVDYERTVLMGPVRTARNWTQYRAWSYEVMAGVLELPSLSGLVLLG